MSMIMANIIDIEHHQKLPKSGTSIRDQMTHKTLIIVLKYRESVENKTKFRNNLDIAILQDQCILLASAINRNDVIIKLSCEKTMDDSKETDDIPLLIRVNHYLRQYQNVTEMSITVNKPYYKPSYWYGGTETRDKLDAAYERYKMKVKYPNRQPFHISFIESPAPWGLDRIDMHYGYLDNEYRYNYTGEMVDVYIIDTGIRTSHIEFEGRAYFLVNTVGDLQNTDCVGHGTHVASIAGSLTYGVAKKIQLFAVKVLDCTGAGDGFTIGAGIMAIHEHHLTRQGRGAVASLSLGGDRSNTLDQAILTLTASGIVTVVAAGNENDDACRYSPAVLAATTNVITVGASTVSDEKPDWSNYGACVSISAPGHQIIGAYHTSDHATTVLSGTSMATPFVSGVAALILSQNPGLSVNEVKSLILQWATPNTISRTTIAGGGKNLLYSLIQTNQIPDVSIPQPQTPPPSQLIIQPPRQRNNGSLLIMPFSSLLFLYIYFLFFFNLI